MSDSACFICEKLGEDSPPGLRKCVRCRKLVCAEHLQEVEVINSHAYIVGPTSDTFVRPPRVVDIDGELAALQRAAKAKGRPFSKSPRANLPAHSGMGFFERVVQSHWDDPQTDTCAHCRLMHVVRKVQSEWAAADTEEARADAGESRVDELRSKVAALQMNGCPPDELRKLFNAVAMCARWIDPLRDTERLINDRSPLQGSDASRKTVRNAFCFGLTQLPLQVWRHELRHGDWVPAGWNRINQFSTKSSEPCLIAQVPEGRSAQKSADLDEPAVYDNLYSFLAVTQAGNMYRLATYSSWGGGSDHLRGNPKAAHSSDVGRWLATGDGIRHIRFGFGVRYVDYADCITAPGQIPVVRGTRWADGWTGRLLRTEADRFEMSAAIAAPTETFNSLSLMSAALMEKVADLSPND